MCLLWPLCLHLLTPFRWLSYDWVSFLFPNRSLHNSSDTFLSKKNQLTLLWRQKYTFHMHGELFTEEKLFDHTPSSGNFSWVEKFNRSVSRYIKCFYLINFFLNIHTSIVGEPMKNFRNGLKSRRTVGCLPFNWFPFALSANLISFLLFENGLKRALYCTSVRYIHTDCTHNCLRHKYKLIIISDSYSGD